MGTQYLIDTNAAIELLSGLLPPSGAHWLSDIIEQDLHALSVINHIELLGFKGSKGDLKFLSDFIDDSQILPLSQKVVLKTIEIRQESDLLIPT